MFIVFTQSGNCQDQSCDNDCKEFETKEDVGNYISSLQDYTGYVVVEGICISSGITKPKEPEPVSPETNKRYSEVMFMLWNNAVPLLFRTLSEMRAWHKEADGARLKRFMANGGEIRLYNRNKTF